MAKHIELSQGYSTVVDDEDYAELSKHLWAAQFISGRYYATRMVPVAGRKLRKAIYMHRQILGIVDAGRNVLGDHINHDTLDNRRANLRITTRKQNQENRAGAQVNNSSTGVRGVGFNTSGRGRPYLAVVKHKGKGIYLGSFDTLEEAANAAKAGRDKYFTHHTD